jgi:hypothetical protein
MLIYVNYPNMSEKIYTTETQEKAGFFCCTISRMDTRKGDYLSEYCGRLTDLKEANTKHRITYKEIISDSYRAYQLNGSYWRKLFTNGASTLRSLAETTH